MKIMETSKASQIALIRQTVSHSHMLVQNFKDQQIHSKTSMLKIKVKLRQIQRLVQLHLLVDYHVHKWVQSKPLPSNPTINQMMITVLTVVYQTIQTVNLVIVPRHAIGAELKMMINFIFHSSNDTLQGIQINDTLHGIMKVIPFLVA